MSQLDGITHEGLKTALSIKENYKKGELVCVPGEGDRILMPENLMNRHLDLHTIDDPLSLAMLATRDPETPMALAAAARFGPMGIKTDLLAGIFQVVGEKSKHPLVRKCVELITESAFSPETITRVHTKTSKFIVNSRKQYTMAMRQNLQELLDGTLAPRVFVGQFFELTEVGNLRNDFRRKLVLSLLLSESIRPSIKFLFIENLERFPNSVRRAIVASVLSARESHHMDIIKEELRWIAAQEKRVQAVATRSGSEVPWH